MCGIAGVFRFRGLADDAASVEHMLARLVHRGPDDCGLETSTRAVLGNRRLAIIDRSAAGHQPMKSSDGRYIVTFNGEIYNFRQLRRELEVADHDMRSQCDTEVLLLAWQRWQARALAHLAGHWAFAIFDTHECKLWLARDRFGEKPLYYHHNSERIAFASSIEALIAAFEVPRVLDPGSVMEYLTLRYVVSPRTVLRDVFKVAPGQILEINSDGTAVEHLWFSPRFMRDRAPARRTRAALDEEFDHLFAQACERCLVSDVPVGLLLSDGLDSNSIRAALAAKGHQPPSFTFRLRGSSAEAVPPGIQPDRVSGTGGAVYDVETTPAERFAALDVAFSSLTEPVGDGASLATWMLLRDASRKATVFLCGHGGDEVFGGYRLSQDRFRLAMLRRFVVLPGGVLDRTMDRFLFGRGSVTERIGRFRDSPVGRAPAGANYLVDRPLPENQIRDLFAAGLPEGGKYLETIERLYAECRTGAADLDLMQEVLMRTFLSANILSFADGVAMNSSTELRMPFLDRDLVDFALSLPAKERASRWPGRTNTKLILRRWSRSRVPTDVVTRPKRGFQSGNISELLQSNGAGLRDRILRAKALRRVVPGLESWVAGVPEDYGGPWGGTVWALLVLGVWCEALGIE